MQLLSASEIIACINSALSAGNQIRMHQNGFLQLDLLDGKSRLHIWSEELPKAQDPRTPIHNHRFCFDSKVILGKLTHVKYEYVPAIQAKNGEGVCQLFTGAGDYEHLVLVKDTEGAVREKVRFDFSAGELYSFGHGLYHDTWGNGLTATIMTKTVTDCIPFATVVVPLGEGGPDNTFRRDQYKQRELMPFVLDVIDTLWELDNRRHV